VKPEDQARQDIDRPLTACGWTVQDRPSMNIHAGPVAVREFPVVKPDGKRGSVDYLLDADAKAIAVVEAKPAEHSLGGSRGTGQGLRLWPGPGRTSPPPAAAVSLPLDG